MSELRLITDRAVVSRPVEFNRTQKGAPYVKLYLKTFHKNVSNDPSGKKNVTEYISGNYYCPEFMIERLMALPQGAVVYNVVLRKEGLSNLKDTWQGNRGVIESLIVPEVVIMDQFAHQDGGGQGQYYQQPQQTQQYQQPQQQFYQQPQQQQYYAPQQPQQTQQQFYQPAQPAAVPALPVGYTPTGTNLVNDID